MPSFAPSLVIIVVAPSVRAGPRKPMAAQAMATLSCADAKPSHINRVDPVASAVKVRSCGRRESMRQGGGHDGGGQRRWVVYMGPLQAAE